MERKRPAAIGPARIIVDDVVYTLTATLDYPVVSIEGCLVPVQRPMSL